MKVFAAESGTLTLVDDSAEDHVLNDLLELMWEEPARLDGGFIFVDDCGRFRASITVMEVLGEHDGIVEVYEVGGPPRRLHVRYVLSDGAYARTAIGPAGGRALRAAGGGSPAIGTTTRSTPAGPCRWPKARPAAVADDGTRGGL